MEIVGAGIKKYGIIILIQSETNLEQKLNRGGRMVERIDR